MTDTNLTIFAERLKELRQKCGLTQKEFADSLSITASALSAYENNSVNPSLLIAKKISEKYSVSLDWLCGIEINGQVKINTLSDLIRELLILDTSQVFNVIYSCNTDTLIDDTVRTSESVEISHFAVYDKYINPDKASAAFFTFFKDWEKMRELYNSNAIDKEVYSLWIEKTLNKYENTLLPKEDMPF